MVKRTGVEETWQKIAKDDSLTQSNIQRLDSARNAHDDVRTRLETIWPDKVQEMGEGLFVSI